MRKFQIKSKVFEVLHVCADALAAGVERRFFFLGERQLHATNGINCTGITAKTDFIEKQASGKRIAAVSVDVYPESATVFNDDTRVVHLDTSKGER